MEHCEKSIGFMDSGLGGLSVLRETIKLLPNEDYIYYGDSKNAPYGTKTLEEVQALTMHNVEFLLREGVKAIVIACNTATSAAITVVREKYKDIPIIGVEPALKPAVSLYPGGKVIIMATTMTLQEEKFHNLMLSHKEEADIIPVPCPGLMEFVERGELDSEDLYRYLNEKLTPYKEMGIDAIVLGCTHYPFIKDAISKVIGSKTAIMDGSHGTAKELLRRLQEHDILNKKTDIGDVTIHNSSGDFELVERSFMLLDS